MAKIGYTRKPDGQNRVPPSTLVPGRHLTGQRPPRPHSGRISNGSTRFWLLITSSVIFPTFDLHAVRSRLYKSCPEMDSGREFRVGITPKTK